MDNIESSLKLLFSDFQPGRDFPRIHVVDAAREFAFLNGDEVDNPETAWHPANLIQFYKNGLELAEQPIHWYAAQNKNGLWVTTEERQVGGELLMIAHRLPFASIRAVNERSSAYNNPWISVEFVDRSAYEEGNHYYVERGSQLIKLTPENTDPEDSLFQKHPPSP